MYFKTSFSPPFISERVNYVRPFQHTGVDFTGHFQVMGDNTLKKKVYILLFTCKYEYKICAFRTRGQYVNRNFSAGIH